MKWRKYSRSLLAVVASILSCSIWCGTWGNSALQSGAGKTSARSASDSGKPAFVTQDQCVNRLLAIMQTLKHFWPEQYVKAIKDAAKQCAPIAPASPAAALTGEQALAYEAALRALHQAEPSNNGEIDTKQLQEIYEITSGKPGPSYVLKNGAPFLVAEREGRFRLFKDDTNYLNWCFSINGHPLSIQDATTSKSYAGHFSLSDGGLPVAVSVQEVILGGRLYQQVTLRNTSATDQPISFDFEEKFDPAFADMFEIRGCPRIKHGVCQPPVFKPDLRLLEYAYTGLDGMTMIDDVQGGRLEPKDDSLTEFTKRIVLQPTHSTGAWQDGIFEMVTPHISSVQLPVEWPKSALGRSLLNAPMDANQQYNAWLSGQVGIESDDIFFNDLLAQAYRDLYALRQPTPGGLAIAAGLPWYAAAFGRDDAITAMQTLPFMPDLSKDVLKTLAFYQGSKCNAATEEKPGKIMHELRVGEMARNHEIPFAPYYGSVDSTPLWVMLLGHYVHQTNDVELARLLQPNLLRALDYLDAEVMRGNGYLTYGGSGNETLANQGWKDSGDSIMYADGRLAVPPIAVCEAQGYLYAAWLEAAEVEKLLGENERAAQLQNKAAELKKRFDIDFWMNSQNFPALALDGQKQQANVIASNAGQLLFTGILSDSQARAVAARLMEPDEFSGFGIRTLSSKEKRYFPNSYHDGSVWPHDNSLIVLGLHRYAPDEAVKVMSGMLSAAEHQPDRRLPELFGGWGKSEVGVPIPYPVSCRPQAWASASLFAMLAANLGMDIDGRASSIRISNPILPDRLTSITLRRLPAGNQSVDLQFTRFAGKVRVHVLRNPGSIKICYDSATLHD